MPRRLAVQRIDGGDPKVIYESPRQVTLAGWSPDGADVAFCSCTWSDRGVVGGDLHTVPADGGDARNLTPGFPGSITWAAWLPDGTGLLATGYRRGRSFFGRVSPNGGVDVTWQGPGGFVDRLTQRFTLTPDARVVAAVHEAQSAVALGDFKRAWGPALRAQFIARRSLLPEHDTPWLDHWRQRLDDAHDRALEAYAASCLGIGGTELPGAERAAGRLLERSPLRETGYALLMNALAAQGNVAEAMRVYDRARTTLHQELGITPGRAIQEAHARLLGISAATP